MIPFRRVELWVPSTRADRRDPDVDVVDGFKLLATVGARPEPERGAEGGGVDLKAIRRTRDYHILSTATVATVKVGDRLKDGGTDWRIVDVERLHRTMRVSCDRQV